jgi:putative PIG3 family NAD(P)H quinone oxidoreductase
MKAIYINEFGSLQNLELRDNADPTAPFGTQVLVRVKAAGLNRADLLQVRGLYPPPAPYSPNIPGLEFAGEIAAIGEEVKGWDLGTRVFGITAGEAQAEFVLTDARLLARVPNHLTFAEAACVPEAFITAHDAIFTLGRLGTQDKLLIHAVGSGVGLAALQLAKAKGAFVVGTSRTEDKLDRCKDLGLAAGIVVRDANDFAERVMDSTQGRGADVILDLVGGAYFDQNLRSLASQGRHVLVGLTSGRTAQFDLGLALQKRARIIGTVLRPRTLEEKAEATRKFADEVVPLFESQTIRPNLDRVFPAGDVIGAYEYLESNVSFGKVVLEF